MPARTSVIRATARANTAAARILMDYKRRGVVVFLLKNAVNAKNFTVVREITDGGWLFDWDSFREAFAFEKATLDPTWPNDVRLSTYLALGVPDADGDVDLYMMDPERRDKVAETTDDPAWKLYVTYVPDRRFRIATP